MEFLGNILESSTGLIYKANQKTNKNLRLLINTVLYAILGILWMLDRYLKFQRIGYIVAILLVLTTVISIEKKIDLSFKQVNKVLLISVILLGILYGLSSFTIGERTRLFHALIFVFVLPVVWYCLSHRDNREFLFITASWGGVVSLFFLIIVSILYAPLSSGQYSAILLNPNGLSQAMIPIFFGIIYLLVYYQENPLFNIKKQRILLVFLLLVLGISAAYLIFTKSRTGLLSALIILFITFIYRFVTLRKEKIKTVLRRCLSSIAAISLSIFLMTNLMIFLLSTVSYQLLLNDVHSKGYAYRFLMLNVHRFEEEDFLAIEQDEEVQDLAKNKSFQSEITALMDRADQGKESGEMVDSGRFEIWSNAWANLNLIGHKSSTKFHVTYNDSYTNNTHNMILNIGYFAGIPAMCVATVFMLAYLLTIAYNSISRLKKNKIDLDDYMLLVVGSTFFILAMISGVFLPIGSVHTFLAWQLVPLENKTQNKKEAAISRDK